MADSQKCVTSRRGFLRGTGSVAAGAVMPGWLSSAAAQTINHKPIVAAIDYRSNSTSLTDPAFDMTAVALHAKYQYSIINMLPDQAALGAAGNKFIRALKNANPDIKVGQYTIATQQYGSDHPRYKPIWQGLDHVGASGYDGWARAGRSSPVGPGGKTKSDWTTTYAAWEVNLLAAGVPAMVANGYGEIMLDNLVLAGLDMVFQDNVWGNPGSGGTQFYVQVGSELKPLGAGTGADYNQDGSNDLLSHVDFSKAPSPAFRTGLAAYASAVRGRYATTRNIEVIANADCDTTLHSALQTRELNQQYEYGFIEALTGEPWSIDTYTGDFYQTLQRYRSQLKGAKKTVFVNAYLNTNRDSLGRTLQRARYALGVTLLDNGVPCIGDRPGGSTVPVRPYWFEDLDTPLGTPIDAPPLSPVVNGLWMRRFNNGCIVVNPCSNRGRWMGNAAHLTIQRKSGVVTLTWPSMPAYGARVGNLVRIQDFGLDPKAGTYQQSFQGTFTLARDQGTGTLIWNQAGPDEGPYSSPLGYFALLSGMTLPSGYTRILGSAPNHDYLRGGSTQNNGTAAGWIDLWAGDALILVKNPNG